MSNSLFLIEYYYSWATKSRPFGTYNVSASATWKSQAVWEIMYLVVVASAVRFSVLFLEEFIQPYFTPGSGWVIPFLQPTEEDHAEDRPRPGVVALSFYPRDLLLTISSWWLHFMAGEVPQPLPIREYFITG